MNLATFRALHLAPRRPGRLRGDDEDFFGGGDDDGGGDDGGDYGGGTSGITGGDSVFVTWRKANCRAMGLVYDEANDTCIDEGGGDDGGGYGPAPGSCEEQGFVTLPNGQCGPRPGTSTQGSEFVEYKGTPEGEEPPEPEYPPHIQAGIERCAQEDKVYDAASDSCVECEDGQESDGRGNCVDKIPARGGGGGGTGTVGHGKAKGKAEGMQISLGARLMFGAIGGLLVGGVAYGGARVAGSKSAGTIGGAGALAGAIAGAFIPGYFEDAYEAVKK